MDSNSSHSFHDEESNISHRRNHYRNNLNNPRRIVSFDASYDNNNSPRRSYNLSPRNSSSGSGPRRISSFDLEGANTFIGSDVVSLDDDDDETSIFLQDGSYGENDLEDPLAGSTRSRSTGGGDFDDEEQGSIEESLAEICLDPSISNQRCFDGHKSFFFDDSSRALNKTRTGGQPRPTLTSLRDNPFVSRRSLWTDVEESKALKPYKSSSTLAIYDNDEESGKGIVRMVCTMGLCILVIIGSISGTYYHVTHYKRSSSPSPSSSDADLTTTVVPSIINETEVVNITDLLDDDDDDDQFTIDQEDQTPLEELPEGDDEVQMPVYEEVKDIVEEQDALRQDINNAETPTEKEALQEEYEVLEELEDAQIEESFVLADLDGQDANNAEESSRDEQVLQIISQQQENLHNVADLLHQQAHAETEEEIEALKQQIEELKEQIKELQQQQMNLQNSKTHKGDGGGDNNNGQ